MLSLPACIGSFAVSFCRGCFLNLIRRCFITRKRSLSSSSMVAVYLIKLSSLNFQLVLITGCASQSHTHTGTYTHTLTHVDAWGPEFLKNLREEGSMDFLEGLRKWYQSLEIVAEEFLVHIFFLGNSLKIVTCSDMRAHLFLPGITVHFSLKQQSASPRGIHGGDVDSQASALLTTVPSVSAGLQVLCPAPLQSTKSTERTQDNSKFLTL